MKQRLVFFILLLLAGVLEAQNELQYYKCDSFSCKYQTTSSMLNGNYVSYYKNGIKKSEGKFQLNNRIGEWDIWDSTGKLRVKRMYENPLDYTGIISDKSNPGKPAYSLKRDSIGQWERYALNFEMIAYMQRDFKSIYTSDRQLFEYKALFNVLYENALKKNFSVYYFGDDIDNAFQTKIDIATIDTSKIKLVGFRIKSDWIFDKTRFISEDFDIGITILVINKNNPKDTVELFTVYYPKVRKYLAQIKLSSPDLPPYIQNLDDIFFFGCYNINFKDFKTSTQLNHITSCRTVECILLNKVEIENNLWLRFKE
jgi:hypothetical protein